MKSEDLGWKLETASTKVHDHNECGKKMIPTASIEINVVKFLESRSREMDAMRESAALVSSNARVMQQLPRHMRRRAASHNVKRLPCGLRLEAEKEMKKSGGVAATKRPSRRHRRRPRCLLQDYERRKRKHVWLETHIWHAKRFRMAELWGYKIPVRPNDRGIRAAYRDSISKCLLFDLSYYCCIEIQGPRGTLLATLSRLTSPDIAPSFASQKFARGTREGQTTLYRCDSYPFHALGEVRFLWRARTDISKTESLSNLWIWTHPSSYQIILNELKTVFDAVEIGDDGGETIAGSVVVSSLKDKLCRFRLVGPRSQEILRRVFQPAKFPDVDSVEGEDNLWWKVTDKVNEHGLFEQQASAWKHMEVFQSPSDLLPNSVYGLVVRDPRVVGEMKKQTATESRCVKQQSGNLESWISASPVWDQDVQEKVKSTMLTTHEINSLKSKNLVPGSPLDLGLRESRIPVLLIQNPGSSSSISSHSLNRLGYGCGWDVVLPGGWSLPFWIALSHCEAHPAGLEELRHISFEQGELFFPDHFPDTPPGADMNLSSYEEANKKYNRIPPAKRINYRKYRIEAPFHFPWKELANGWRVPAFSDPIGRTNDFSCLRDKSILQFLQKMVDESFKQAGKNQIPGRGIMLETVSQKLHTICNDPYLVPVQLVMCTRGAAGKFSIICIPGDVDIAQYAKSPNEPGLVNESRVKKTKSALHSNKRKQEKSGVISPLTKKSKLESDNLVACKVPEDVHENSAFANAGSKNPPMELDQTSRIPDKTNQEIDQSLPVIADIKNSCSRQIFGYVITDGGLSFSKGCGSSLGFVSLQGLMLLIERQKEFIQKNMNKEKVTRKDRKNSVMNSLIVLVRSTRCDHYRFAQLNILQKS